MVIGDYQVKNVQLQIVTCKLNEQLQREQEGRDTGHVTQIPD